MNRIFSTLTVAVSLISATSAQAQTIDLKCQIENTLDGDQEILRQVMIIHLDGQKSFMMWTYDGKPKSLEHLQITDASISFCIISCSPHTLGDGSVEAPSPFIVSRADGTIFSEMRFVSRKGTTLLSHYRGQCQKYSIEQRKF